jgi:hypothetical protein
MRSATTLEMRRLHQEKDDHIVVTSIACEWEWFSLLAPFDAIRRNPCRKAEGLALERSGVWAR